jgi:hypothetical protein
VIRTDPGVSWMGPGSVGSCRARDGTESGNAPSSRVVTHELMPGATPGHHTGRKSATLPSSSRGDGCAFLDHSSLAVTTTYLRRLEGVEDHSWERVAEAIGV